MGSGFQPEDLMEGVLGSFKGLGSKGTFQKGPRGSSKFVLAMLELPYRILPKQAYSELLFFKVSELVRGPSRMLSSGSAPCLPLDLGTLIR